MLFEGFQILFDLLLAVSHVLLIPPSKAQLNSVILCVGLQPSASVYSLCVFPAGCMETVLCEIEGDNLGRKGEKGGVKEQQYVCESVCLVYTTSVFFAHSSVCLSVCLSCPCNHELPSAFQWRVTPVTTLL